MHICIDFSCFNNDLFISSLVKNVRNNMFVKVCTTLNIR